MPSASSSPAIVRRLRAQPVPSGTIVPMRSVGSSAKATLAGEEREERETHSLDDIADQSARARTNFR